jgi:hypothetical protein
LHSNHWNFHSNQWEPNIFRKKWGKECRKNLYSKLIPSFFNVCSMEPAKNHRSIVRQFFTEDLRQPDIDEEIIEYICGALQTDDEDIEAEELAELVSSFSAAFRQLTLRARETSAASLIARCHQANNTSGVGEPPAGVHHNPRPIPAVRELTANVVRDGTNADSYGRTRARPSATTTFIAQEPRGRADNDVHSDSDASLVDASRPPGQQASNASGEERWALETLSAMFECDASISISHAYLHHILKSRCGGSVHVAADMLLSMADAGLLQGDAAAWDKENVGTTTLHQTTTQGSDAPSVSSREAKMGLESPDQALRKSIAAKYHLEAVPLDGRTVVAGKQPVAAWGDGGHAAKKTNGSRGSEKALRYRDGVVVATKGEKYIVETEPEWDGGSRGRVKTKRKGGVGWV